MKTEELEKLLHLAPCEVGLEFVRKFDTLQEAWDNCANFSWLVWLIRQTDKENAEKNLRLIAADIAESVLHIFEEKYSDDKRPRKAIEATRKWVRGELSNDELLTAANVAYASAADVAYASASAYACAAAYAASADAAYAAAYAAYAAYAYAASNKHEQNQLNCDIVRRYYPQVPI